MYTEVYVTLNNERHNSGYPSSIFLKQILRHRCRSQLAVNHRLPAVAKRFVTGNFFNFNHAIFSRLEIATAMAGTAVTFLSVTLAHVILRLRVAREIIGFLSVTDTYIHTYILEIRIRSRVPRAANV